MSDYQYINVDVGDMCHSAKQMPFLVNVMCSVIDEVVQEALMHPLQCTGISPHFHITFDKATFNGITNQVLLACGVTSEKRSAFVVDTTSVYSVGESNYLEGGSSEELVALIRGQFSQRWPLVPLSICVAAVADGQYQTRKFLLEMEKQCGIDVVQ